MNHEEQEYLNLLKKIIDDGSDRQDRTGVGTKSIFGTQLRFSLENNVMPLLTTKKIFYRGVIEELLFFIRGETDTKKLEEKNVFIWQGNTSREYLDKHGLQYLPVGNMGKGYGYNWRNFSGKTDQLKNVLKSIIEEPHDRERKIVTAWNPSEMHEVALPCCHILFQFYVDKGKLSCQFNMRSCDTALGLPFNIASYSILTILMAKAAGLEAGELIFVGGDTHIYLSHFEQVKEQISRDPFPFPTMKINKEINSIEDMENLSFEDFEINNYQHHPAIKADMAI